MTCEAGERKFLPKQSSSAKCCYTTEKIHASIERMGLTTISHFCFICASGHLIYHTTQELILCQWFLYSLRPNFQPYSPQGLCSIGNVYHFSRAPLLLPTYSLLRLLKLICMKCSLCSCLCHEPKFACTVTIFKGLIVRWCLSKKNRYAYLLPSLCITVPAILVFFIALNLPVSGLMHVSIMFYQCNVVRLTSAIHQRNRYPCLWFAMQ